MTVRPAGLVAKCPVHGEVIAVFRWTPTPNLKACCPCCGVFLADMPKTNERLELATGVPRR